MMTILLDDDDDDDDDDVDYHQQLLFITKDQNNLAFGFFIMVVNSQLVEVNKNCIYLSRTHSTT